MYKWLTFKMYVNRHHSSYLGIVMKQGKWADDRGIQERRKAMQRSE